MSDKTAQNGTHLTHRQHRAINGLLYSTSVTQASEISGISRRVIHKWLNDSGFRAELARAREQLTSESRDNLKVLFTQAIGVLYDVLMESGDERTKLRACEIVLNNFFKGE